MVNVNNYYYFMMFVAQWANTFFKEILVKYWLVW